MKVSRRKFIKLAGTTAMVAYLQSQYGFSRVLAEAAAKGLSDPAQQPKFANRVPDALAPDFIFEPVAAGAMGEQYNVVIQQTEQYTGLVNPGGQPVATPVWGYGYGDARGVTWPGRTFQVKSSVTSTGGNTLVKWDNQLVRQNGKPLPHLLPVDTHLHWAFSLPGYEQYTIADNGVPIITHLHGGRTAYLYDGNPEFFYTPGYQILGPQWEGLGDAYLQFVYDNSQPAGNLWYHDHALGITRLNVYAGLAGFYFIRDDRDTGLPDNRLGLPAWPYEKAYAIQDRMFEKTGELFYPAFPGDPFYADFIAGEGAILPPDLFPGGGPTALAEFFGDHMVVNGVIWPYEEVEPRHYRLRLLNGTDSRFMVLRFRSVPAGATDVMEGDPVLPFTVIGSDQGLGTAQEGMTQLVFEPGGRYDIVFDFAQVPFGSRVIMENLGGDEPFGGEIPGPQLFEFTDRVMAFDVVLPKDGSVDDKFKPVRLGRYNGVPGKATVRRVALFEGTDEFGRLQPLLGTVKPGDLNVENVATAYPWHAETTEKPQLGGTEVWEIYNFTADAHPIHLHLVDFEILDRQVFEYDVTGTQTIVQHNGEEGEAPEVSNLRNFVAADLSAAEGYFERAPKDMVTALPGDADGDPPTGQVTRIKVHFDKTGRYVWHCHILSHEDHEMMRVLQVIE